MENDTATRKKAYAAPTVTRHGDVVDKTLGAGGNGNEMFVPGTPDWH